MFSNLIKAQNPSTNKTMKITITKCNNFNKHKIIKLKSPKHVKSIKIKGHHWLD